MKLKISPEDRETLSIIMELSKAVRCCRQDEVFCEGVTLVQFAVLDSIAGSGKLNMARLHDVLAVDKSTTTRLVTPLIKRGLVIREKADHDSRAATLKLTAEGAKVHGDVWECLLSFLRAVNAELPPGRKDEAYEGVRLFLGVLQKVSLMRCAADAGLGGCGCKDTSRARARQMKGSWNGKQ